MDKTKRAEFMKMLKSIPTQRFEPSKKAYLHQHFAEHKEALIGLEYLVEAHCASDAVEPAYVCTVCEWWLCQAHNVLDHVASKRHRKSYLDSVKNRFDSVTSAFLERCDLHKAARIYEELYARKTVGLMFTRSFGRALLACRDMPACRINDPTIACKPPQLHIPALESAISISHAAIVPALSNEGLEAVIEMRAMDEKRQPGYFCKTCVSRHNSTVGIVRHLTSVVHRWAYLSLPLHVNDSKLTELLKCGPEDKDGITEAAKYFEGKRGRQCVSLTFVDRFDSSICNAWRKANPSDLSTKKTRKQLREQQRKQESAIVSDLTAPNPVVAPKRKATDEINLSSGGQIKEKSVDAGVVVSKRVKEEPLSAACNGTFEISAPVLPAAKPYVGLFPPKSKATQGGVKLSKAAGDFSTVEKNIFEDESGAVEQGVMQEHWSFDAVAGQFLSASAAATSIVSSASSFAGFPNNPPAYGPFHSQYPPATNLFSSSSAVGTNSLDQFSSTAARKMTYDPGLSVSQRLFSNNSSLISSSINGGRAAYEPQPVFLAGPATISAPETMVTSNSSSAGAIVSSKSRASAPELDVLSLINDAANTADAALHECSAQQLVALLLAERKAVEAQDRLIAKLANELLEKEIV